jgi:non-specific serine/threonine protein kinase
MNHGFAALHLHRAADAVASLEQSVRICEQLEDTESVAYCLHGLAAVAELHGRSENAARVLGAADALRETIGASLAPFEQGMHDRTARAARVALGQAQFDAAWTAGRALSLDEAVAYALEAAAEVPVTTPS